MSWKFTGGPQVLYFAIDFATLQLNEKSPEGRKYCILPRQLIAKGPRRPRAAQEPDIIDFQFKFGVHSGAVSRGAFKIDFKNVSMKKMCFFAGAYSINAKLGHFMCWGLLTQDSRQQAVGLHQPAISIHQFAAISQQPEARSNQQSTH